MDARIREMISPKKVVATIVSLAMLIVIVVLLVTLQPWANTSTFNSPNIKWAGGSKSVGHGKESSPPQTTATASSASGGQKESNEDEIEGILSEAQNHISNADYGRALNLLAAGIETHPDSQKLKDAYDALIEYISSMNSGPRESEDSNQQQIESNPMTNQTVEVPNVVGNSEEEATTHLSSAGLIPLTTIVPNETIAAGYVVSQSISGTATRGSTVYIQVSSGPETTVPDPDSDPDPDPEPEPNPDNSIDDSNTDYFSEQSTEEANEG